MIPFTAESGWAKELSDQWRKIQESVEIDCPQCNGTGWPCIDKFDSPCSKCNGHGKTEESTHD